MKVPRNLSGQELIQMLVKNLGYKIVHQRGSHVVVETEDPSRHRIAVPDHKILRIGTLNAILKAVAQHKGISKVEILALI
jgi:predicted RNA binding protein YcfA (HicA-like mRNA interferase family)